MYAKKKLHEKAKSTVLFNIAYGKLPVKFHVMVEILWFYWTSKQDISTNRNCYMKIQSFDWLERTVNDT